jgi:thiol-disulfide isomerase/thioredoxin
MRQSDGEEERAKHEYWKYKKLLKSGNEKMILRYFPTLSTTFMYQGYTPALQKIRPLWEKKLPGGELKTRLIATFDKFERFQPGKPAPEFHLQDVTGKERTLSEFRGKIVVIDVWATWCSGCMYHLPEYIAIAKKYAGRDDIVFIGVSQDRNQDDWKRGIKQKGAEGLLNLFASPAFGRDFNIPGIPHYMVIDAKGNYVISKITDQGEHLSGVEKVVKQALNKKK